MKIPKEKNQTEEVEKKKIQNMEVAAEKLLYEVESEQEESPNGFQNFLNLKGDFNKAIGCGG
jgi:hypothetical protein